MDDKPKVKNPPLGAQVVEQAAALNIQKRKEQMESKKNVDSREGQAGANDANNRTRATAPKKTKGVIGAKGVKLQPIQAKLKPNLYAMHQDTIEAVNELTDSNITSADVMRASVYLLSKIKPEKILQAIRETAI